MSTPLSGVNCGLKITIEPGLVRMAGEIDMSNSHELATGLDSAVPQDHRLILDLSGVGFIDVAGTEQVVEFARRCRPDEVCLLGAPRPLAVILGAAGWASEVTLLEANEALRQ